MPREKLFFKVMCCGFLSSLGEVNIRVSHLLVNTNSFTLVSHYRLTNQLLQLLVLFGKIANICPLMVITFIMTFLILILIHLEPRYLQLTLSSTFLTVLAQIRFPLAFSKFAHLISKLAANYALLKSRVINTGLTNWIVYL